MSSLLRDLRHSVRLLWKEKVFTLTVLVTLAVCVGVNASIFSVVNTVLLQPLPFKDPEQLVVVSNSYPGAGVPRADNGVVDYFARRERVPSFAAVAQWQNTGYTVGEAGRTERVPSMRVTASFFPLLGVQPLLGRTFREEEMDAGNQHVVMLTHGYWQERFAGDRGVLDRDLRIGGQPYRIVGVLPPEFRLPQNEQPRLFVPIMYSLESRRSDNWHNNSFEMWARLRPGATVEQARAENDALNTAMIAEWNIPNAAQLLNDAGYRTLIEPAGKDLVRDVRSTLHLLWGGALFVLLIGCVNIAGLILARGQTRLRDMATRLAIGAPRRRLIRELLVHALTLALLGGTLGVLLALAGVKLLGAFGAGELPRGALIGVDLTVLLFTLGLAVGAGLVFGAIPSAQLLRVNIQSVLQTETRGGTAGRRTLSLRTALVTTQVGLAFLLLIGTGLMLVSFRSAVAVKPGFQPEGVFTAFLSLAGPGYGEPSARQQFAEALLDDIRTLPGVQAAGITTQLPFAGGHSSSVVLPEGYTLPPGESLLSPLRTVAGGDYFQAMAIPLIEGRLFEPQDGAGDRRVIILDEWLARRYFGDASPLGRRMLDGAVPEIADEDDYYTVIGVVGTIKQNDLTAPSAEHVGAHYFPYRANPGSSFSLVVRTDGDPLLLSGAVRDRIMRLDPELPMFNVQTLRGRIDTSLTGRRTSMRLLVVFSSVALFLAVIGVYGILAYTVAQRQREIGIRMALGSSTHRIFMLVLRHGLRVTGAGLLIGAVAALFMGRFMQSLLFGVEPIDIRVLLTAGAVLGTVALAACVIPALQAARIDPVRAIIDE